MCLFAYSGWFFCALKSHETKNLEIGEFQWKKFGWIANLKMRMGSRLHSIYKVKLAPFQSQELEFLLGIGILMFCSLLFRKEGEKTSLGGEKELVQEEKNKLELSPVKKITSLGGGKRTS